MLLNMDDSAQETSPDCTARPRRTQWPDALRRQIRNFKSKIKNPKARTRLKTFWIWEFGFRISAAAAAICLLAGCAISTRKPFPAAAAGGLPSAARNRHGGYQQVPVTYTHPGDRFCYDTIEVDDVRIVNDAEESGVTLVLRNTGAERVEFIYVIRFFGDTPADEIRTRKASSWTGKTVEPGATTTIQTRVHHPGIRAVALSVMPHKVKPREPVDAPPTPDSEGK